MSNEIHNDLLSSLLATSGKAQSLTDEMLSVALREFRLGLPKNLPEFGQAVRYAFGLSLISMVSVWELEKGNSLTATAFRGSMLKIGRTASNLVDLLRDFAEHDDRQYLDWVFERKLALDPRNRQELPIGKSGVDELISDLTGLSQALNELAGTINVRDSKRIDTMRRRAMVVFARKIAPIYEQAYGRKASVSDHESVKTGNRELGPWPDFFQRIACTAYDLDKVPDLLNLLANAREERTNLSGL